MFQTCIRRQMRLAGLTLAGIALAGSASAQAWVAEPGTGTVALSYQYTDVRKHLFSGDVTLYGGTSDGKLDLGRVKGQSVDLDLGYSPYRNLQLTAGLAYVGGTYNGTAPESAELDDGKFHGSLQDASLGLSYMIPWNGFAVTPSLAYTFPASDYDHHGHAAAGRQLTSLGAGLMIGHDLGPWVPGGFTQASYTRFFVEDIEAWGLDAHRIGLDVGWSLTPALGIRGYFSYYEVSDGIDWYVADFSAPAVEHNHDAAAASLVRRAGGALSFQFDATKGIFVDFGAVLSGVNTHDALSFTIGTTWSFIGPSIH